MKRFATGIIWLVVCALWSGVGYSKEGKGKQDTSRSACTVEEFKFVGNDADFVGPLRQWEPNGVPDGHLRLTLASKSFVGIKSITVRVSRGGIWSSGAAHWVLGIYADGEKLHALEPGEIMRATGEKVLDLYLEPNEYRFFASGDEFQVTVQLADDTLLVSHCKAQWENLAQHVVVEKAKKHRE